MKRIAILWFYLILSYHCDGQYIEIGGSLGGSSYQGDISHLSSRFSIQGARFLNSVHVGYHFYEYYSLKFRVSHATIGAYDSESVDINRRERNLHFQSAIREFALINEFELLDVIKFFRKYNLKPYVNFGLAYFSFNPQAKFKGQWVDLQPLSTEGQGMPGYKAPYRLHQLSIPFGFGMKYQITKDWYVGFEISPRITFTDYLDDVSGDYPDMEQLRNFRGDIAVELSYQGDKVPGSSLEFDQAKAKDRGNPRDNDWYIFNSLVVGYTFDPVKSIKKRRSFRHGRKCNFFGK